ncbi:MAG: hypothetical protein ACK53L_02125, partial [Pirellulaceae bacterium]
MGATVIRASEICRFCVGLSERLVVMSGLRGKGNKCGKAELRARPQGSTDGELQKALESWRLSDLALANGS